MVSSLLALVFVKKREFHGKKEADFACVITVYKEVDIAWPLVRSLLAQNYSNFHIYMIADEVGMVQSPIFHKRFHFFQPESALNSKVASIDYVLKRMGSMHTHVVIVDPDSLVPSHFLSALDRFHSAGFPVVQGR